MGDNKPYSSQKRDRRNTDDYERNRSRSTESETQDNLVESTTTPDVELWEWDQFISAGHEALKDQDIVNLERCRLLVLSGTTTKVMSDEEEEILTLCTEEILKCRESLQRDHEKKRIASKEVQNKQNAV